MLSGRRTYFYTMTLLPPAGQNMWHRLTFSIKMSWRLLGVSSIHRDTAFVKCCSNVFSTFARRWSNVEETLSFLKIWTTGDRCCSGDNQMYQSANKWRHIFITMPRSSRGQRKQTVPWSQNKHKALTVLQRMVAALNFCLKQ